METGEKNNYVRCILKDIEAVSVMKGLSQELIYSILKRMDVTSEKNISKEASLIALKEAFFENNGLLLQILSKKQTELLIEIWDHDFVIMDNDSWEDLKYLKLFGLLTYKKGNAIFNESDEIYVIEEMKQHLYFLFKGKDSKNKIKQYDEWEKIVLGLIYVYGLISLHELYSLFITYVQARPSKEEFSSFLRHRDALWSIGKIVSEKNGDEYYSCMNVDNKEFLYLSLKAKEDLHYKVFSREELERVVNGAGIDNRWSGLLEAGVYLMDELEVSYYRANVLIRTIVMTIQNGYTMDKVIEPLNLFIFPSDKERKDLNNWIRTMFDNIPIYEYKGHTRSEYYKYIEEKSLKKRRNNFTIIKGGQF